MGHFVESGVERSEALRVVELQRAALTRASGRDALDALDAADREDELAEALEEHDVEEPWRLAEPLAAAGLNSEWVQAVAERPGPPRAPRCAGWRRP